MRLSVPLVNKISAKLVGIAFTVEELAKNIRRCQQRSHQFYRQIRVQETLDIPAIMVKTKNQLKQVQEYKIYSILLVIPKLKRVFKANL